MVTKKKTTKKSPGKRARSPKGEKTTPSPVAEVPTVTEETPTLPADIAPTKPPANLAGQEAREDARRLRRERRERDAASSAVAGGEESSSARPVPSAVASIDKARRDKKERGEPTTVVEPPKDPVYIEIDELNSYKLLHLNDKKVNATAKVKDPLVKSMQQRLDGEIAQLQSKCQAELLIQIAVALEKSEAFNAANKEHIMAVNAVIEAMGPKLDEGFAVTVLEPEKQRVRTDYNPAQVGKLLDVPG